MAHDQEVVGSNTGIIYWMDVSNFSLRAKLKIKVAKWGTPRKKKKNIMCLLYSRHKLMGSLWVRLISLQ
jgi:hypothetical protein